MRTDHDTVLVTGGGSGIGRGLAIALHQTGNRVIIAGRRVETLQHVCREHPGIAWMELDQSDPDSVHRLVDRLATEHPDLNVLVNNASMVAFEDLAEPNPGRSAAIVATNLVGPITLTMLLLPRLRAQPSSAIINVTSGLAFVPLAASPTYCATKAALHSWTQSLRFQLRDNLIEVIEIVPPRVRTDAPGPVDADTMELDHFITEVMRQLRGGTYDGGEVLVGGAHALRHAERNGCYVDLYSAVNAPDPQTRSLAESSVRHTDEGKAP